MRIERGFRTHDTSFSYEQVGDNQISITVDGVNTTVTIPSMENGDHISVTDIKLPYNPISRCSKENDEISVFLFFDDTYTAGSPDPSLPGENNTLEVKPTIDELKAAKKEEVRRAAYDELTPGDYKIIRQLERIEAGETPDLSQGDFESLSAFRQAIRDKCNQKESDIDACSTRADVRAITWQ